MELYTRIIDEGIFIFWDEQNINRYELSVFIYNNDKKIRLVNTKIEQGINCYSLTHIGSGNYEIELNIYNDNRLIETVTKKATLMSTSQRSAELIEKLDNVLEKIDEVTYAIDSFDISAMNTIARALKIPNEALNEANWAVFLLKLEQAKNKYRKEMFDW